MWEIVRNITEAAWPLLPEITIGLRFCTAVIGLGLATRTAILRVRRRQARSK